jgi:hypothetical protein
MTSGADNEGLMDLLYQKVEQAKAEIQAELTRTLFGEEKKVDIGEMKSAMRGARADQFAVSPGDFYDLTKSMEPLTRYQDNGLADAGKQNVLFQGVPVVADKTVPKGTLYGVNMNAIDQEKSFTGINGLIMDNYKKTITDNLYKEGVLQSYITSYGNITTTWKKEKEMSITKNIRAELNEAKETKRVTKALNKFEGSWLYKLPDGAHIGWDWTPGEGGKTYTYAAIFTGKCWHMTGARSPYSVSTDDLVDWLIEHEISFKNVKLFKAVK